jgi:hypothetical protein
MTEEMDKYIEEIYIQHLECDIIEYLAKELSITLIIAMDIYYSSELCGLIQNGTCGIQYLDYKNLALDLIENEAELVRAKLLKTEN